MIGFFFLSLSPEVDMPKGETNLLSSIMMMVLCDRVNFPTVFKSLGLVS